MMYRVILECSGIPNNEGYTAAQGITRAFAEHRPHHKNVTCSFVDGKLILVAENDFDPKGLALMDELSDCLSAYTSMHFDGDITVKSATII
jgi:hypothetical protein